MTLKNKEIPKKCTEDCKVEQCEPQIFDLFEDNNIHVGDVVELAILHGTSVFTRLGTIIRLNNSRELASFQNTITIGPLSDEYKKAHPLYGGVPFEHVLLIDSIQEVIVLDRKIVDGN